MESQISSDEEFTEQCEEELTLFSRFILNGVDNLSEVQESSLNSDLQKLLIELHEEKKNEEASSPSISGSAVINELIDDFAPSSLKTIQEAYVSPDDDDDDDDDNDDDNGEKLSSSETTAARVGTSTDSDDHADAWMIGAGPSGAEANDDDDDDDDDDEDDDDEDDDHEDEDDKDQRRKFFYFIIGKNYIC